MVTDPHGRFTVPGGVIDLHEARFEGAVGEIPLTPTEVAALAVMARAAPEPVSQEILLRDAWGVLATQTRTVPVTLGRLRKKIEAPGAPPVIVNVRGAGYRLILAERTTAPERHRPPPIGRGKDLHSIHSAFDSGAHLVTLVGIGGVGKTEIARAWAVRKRCAWVSLEGAETVDVARRRFTEALDCEASQLEAALKEAQFVAVDALGAVPDPEVEAWIVRSGARVLATALAPTGWDGEHLHTVGPLNPEHAAELVAKIRGQRGLPTGSFDLMGLGGLPLALVAAAPILDVLGHDESVVWHLPDGGRTVADAFARTLQQLSPGARDLLGVMACFGGPVRPTWLADLCETPLPLVFATLADLRSRGLVSVVPEGFQILPPLVAHLRASPSDRRERWLAWLSRIPRTPSRLRPLRREIERGLLEARGDRRVALFLRHLEVLHTFGPLQGLEEDAEHVVSDLPGWKATVLWALTQLCLYSWDGVEESLQAVVSTIPENEVDWSARAWSLLAVSRLWGRDPVGALKAIRHAVSLLPAVTDRVLAMDIELRLGEILRRTGEHGAEDAFRSVLARSEGYPSRTLKAEFALVIVEDPDPLRLRRLGALLRRARAATGRVPWNTKRGQLAALLLELGDSTGLDPLEAALAALQPTHPTLADQLRIFAAPNLLDRPDACRRILEPMRQSQPADFHLFHGLLARDLEEVSLSGHAEATTIAAAFFAMQPIPPSEPFRRLVRALRAHRRRHPA